MSKLNDDSDAKVTTTSKPQSNSSDNTSNQKMRSNGDIFGDEIVKIVSSRTFGKTDLKAIVENGDTIEESLRTNAEIFETLATRKKEEALTELGIQCGLDKFVAMGLAVKLMRKSSKQQSVNSM